MSKNKQTNHDQANELRNKVGKDENETEEIQLTSLPSRSEIHQRKKKKTKWKLKYPIIKTLAFFFILLPIVIYSVFTYLGGQSENRAKQVNKESSGFETVDIDKQNNKKTTMEVREQESKEVESEDKENKQASEETNQPSEEKQPEKQRNHNTVNENKPKTVDRETSGNKQTDKQDNNLYQKPSTEANQPNESNQPNANLVYHSVQPNETLFRISMKYYHSQAGIDIIKNANGLASNDIHVGQVLKIPLNK